MENGAKTGYVHSLESFGSVDGPGVRYVIFLSGCAMRCQFCHNPDTWNMTAGKSYTADALLKQAVKYRTYWGNKGGITVSGGEPLLQIDFLIELFRKAKEMGIHTTLDTSGNPYTEKEPFYSKWLELMKYTDLILLDIMLPGADGFELMDLIRPTKTPVIFLTALGSTEHKVKGLRMGADDYLPKPFEPLELVLRIKNILKRAPQVREEVRDKLDLGLCVYDLHKQELHTKQGQIIHITPVEQALLGVLGQKSGQIFTREKLAELLGAGQSPRSIDVQITRLRKKIEKDSKNPRYLQTVRGKGYMLLPE